MSVGDDAGGGGVDRDSGGGEQQQKPNIKVSWGCSKYLFTKYMIFFHLLYHSSLNDQYISKNDIFSMS